MPDRTELGDFLRTRRARLQPVDVGLVWHGARRVPGLRREELAQLAGVSPAYYTRLEQGISANASDQVLDALAAALRLDPDEQQHLRNLARPAAGAGRSRPRRAERLRPDLSTLVTALDGVAAVVLDRCGDVLAWNPLAHRLLAGHVAATAPEQSADRPNLFRMLFRDPHTRDLYEDLPRETRRAVASLRLLAGRHPDDPALTALVGELCIHGADFAALWAGHRVLDCRHGAKRLRHPTVGRLELAFTVLDVADGTGHRLLTLSAAPDSAARAALRLLA